MSYRPRKIHSAGKPPRFQESQVRFWGLAAGVLVGFCAEALFVYFGFKYDKLLEDLAVGLVFSAAIAIFVSWGVRSYLASK